MNTYPVSCDAPDSRLAPAPRLPHIPRRYVGFFRTPANRWWRGVLALLLTAALAALAQIVGAIPMIIGMFRGTVEPTGDQLTPGMFAGALLALAFLTPIVLLAARACFGTSPRWQFSVEGRFRWAWLAHAAMLVLLTWVVGLALGLWATPSLLGDGSQRTADPALWLALVVLLMPVQAAGEEFLFRGLLPRVVASWVPNERAGFVVATAISSALFAVAHASADPWRLLYYFGFAVIASLLVHYTGGLEAAIALHAVNNLVTGVLGVVLGDASRMIDPSAPGDPALLLPLLAGVPLVLLARRSAARQGLSVASAPGRR